MISKVIFLTLILLLFSSCQHINGFRKGNECMQRAYNSLYARKSCDDDEKYWSVEHHVISCQLIETKNNITTYDCLVEAYTCAGEPYIYNTTTRVAFCQ